MKMKRNELERIIDGVDLTLINDKHRSLMSKIDDIMEDNAPCYHSAMEECLDTLLKMDDSESVNDFVYAMTVYGGHHGPWEEILLERFN